MNGALAWDIETVPTEAALAAPYPEGERNPPANFKDPEKIAAWREKDRQLWQDERIKECSLSPRTGRIVAAGFSTRAGVVNVCIAESEDAEAGLLLRMWKAIAEAGGKIITFNGTTFDIPFFLVRSLIKGVKPTVMPSAVRNWTRRYSYAPHYDVRAVLSGFDYHAKGRLSDWCSAFSISSDDECSGADVYEKYRQGDFDAIEKHVRSDVNLTVGLYKVVSQVYGELA